MLFLLILASTCLSLIPSVGWITSVGMTRGMRCSIDISFRGILFERPSPALVLGSAGAPPPTGRWESVGFRYGAGGWVKLFAPRLGWRKLSTLARVKSRAPPRKPPRELHTGTSARSPVSASRRVSPSSLYHGFSCFIALIHGSPVTRSFARGPSALRAPTTAYLRISRTSVCSFLLSIRSPRVCQAESFV